MVLRVASVDCDLTDINELINIFRRRVTKGVLAYISFEFRDGALLYYHNNAARGPVRQP